MARVLSLAVAALFCLGLAACGDTLSPTTATPFISGGGPTTASNLCGLLSAEDLNNIIPGQDFKAGSEQGIYCNFEGQADLIDLGATAFSTDNEATVALDHEKEASAGQAIPNLGDAAYWEPENSDLIVVKGHAYIFLELFTTDDAGTQEGYAISIAKVVLDHLP